MFEELGFETLTAPQAAIWLGVLLGLGFGALAQVTRFCLRRSLVGEPGERRSAAGVWTIALAVAVIGTQAAVAMGWIGFGEHRFLDPNLPVLAIAIGGLAFGAGMVLTRGCVSRLTVLVAGGNLRALTVLLIFAISAHATLKGVLSGVRTGLGSVTLPLGETTSLAALPGGALLWGGLIAVAALAIALRSGARPLQLALAAALGLLVPLGWVGTGYVLYDDFDPIAMQSLSFTLPYADTLFWTVAATSIPASFGVGLVGGTVAGALVLTVLRREFRWQSFETPAQTGRYVLGALLMGFGGVLAGGCSVGAGLSGVPTLGLAAILALASIAAGALATHRMVDARRVAATAAVPAE
ncbi:YeeE/YedE family protein [Pseudoruegeria sp. HB172150]|uniref:YeeE/YedE family protein n=1 Tax=Pseudoruegeria sp. HB172150 TaxID=2721164 RepID=UPI0015516B33|nr:YeeE/YedE family protein [Pseudoruegeria sp. HB172150]